MCKPGKVGAGTVEGSVAMAAGSMATPRPGRRPRASPARLLALEVPSFGGVGVAAVAKTAVFVAGLGIAAVSPSSLVLDKEPNMNFGELGRI